MSVVHPSFGHIDPPGARPTGPTAVPLRAAPPASAEIVDLLAWVARGPRTYAAAMAVWQTSCPRHSVWEDACSDGLILVETGSGGPMVEAPVTLTARGRALLRDSDR